MMSNPGLPTRGDSTLRDRLLKSLRICFGLGASLVLPVGWMSAEGGGEPFLPWTCSFEAVDGFTADQAPPADLVWVLGGVATVQKGEAADGVQFVRFLGRGEDDAVAVRIGERQGAARRQSIAFAARFPDVDRVQRLIMTSRQTVVISPRDGSLEVAVDDRPATKIERVDADGRGWISIELVDNPEHDGWVLLIDGNPAAAVSGAQSVSADLIGLLVVADGSVDLDAIRVSYCQNCGSVASPSPMPPYDSGTSVTADDEKNARENDTLAQAYIWATLGRINAAKLAIASLESSDVDPRRSDPLLFRARLYASLAHALHDGYFNRAAVSMAEEAVEAIRRLEASTLGSATRSDHADAAFIVGGLYERVIFDELQAEREYRHVIEIDPNHLGAIRRLDRILDLKRDENASKREDGEGGVE